MIPEEEKKKKKDRVQKEKRERKKEGGHFMSLNVERSLPSIKLTFKKRKMSGFVQLTVVVFIFRSCV